MEFTDNYIVTWKINGLVNPDWGFTREKAATFTSNFDINDTEVFPAYDK